MSDTGLHRQTISDVICRSPNNPDGAFPYKRQKQPQFDERMRKQRVAYAELGPITRRVKAGTWEETKDEVGFGDHTPASKTGAINSTHNPSWLTRADKKDKGVESGGSSKYGVKPQV